MPAPARRSSRAGWAHAAHHRPPASPQSGVSASTHGSLGCWRYAGSGLFRETQVLGQRPRTGSPYRYSIITHQHYQVLGHFGPTQCPVQLSFPLYFSVEKKHTRKLLDDSSFAEVHNENPNFSAFSGSCRMWTRTRRRKCSRGSASGDLGECISQEPWYSVTAALVHYHRCQINTTV